MVSEYHGVHLDPSFVDHLIFFICRGHLGPQQQYFAVFFGATWTQPYLVSLHGSSVSFVILFSLFFASDVKAAASRTFGVVLCEKFWLSAFNSQADNTVNYCKSFCKCKAWCLHSTWEIYFLPATSITVSSYLHHLLKNSLGSSTIYSVFTLLIGYISQQVLRIAISVSSFL